MPRPPGRPNDDHDTKRAALVHAVMPLVLAAGPERPSLRELARAAGVLPNTLRHYFGDREGLVEAVLAQARRDGEPHLAALAGLAALPLREALGHALAGIVAGWTDAELGGLHAGGLAEGLGSPSAGPAYVTHVLEPTLRATEDLLAASGVVPAADVRAATLALLSPVLVALLHQRQLGGGTCRPLDVDAFVARHLDAWWRGWVDGRAR